MIVMVGLLTWVSSALARPTTAPQQVIRTAHSSQSTNWAGYAVRRTGTSFRRVVGVWTAPDPACRRGDRTFSSYWVGLGGYSTRSSALEQAGTEVDCTSTGQARAFAWYELIPAGSVRLHLGVTPGDLIRATVTVTGRRVRFALQDLTRHTTFSKVLSASVVDVSSAEWIVEAPSECVGNGRCFTLPLANFGLAGFDGALVAPLTGAAGPISDGRWTRTQIRLVPHDEGFVLSHPTLGSGGDAFPSGLQGDGSAFSVSYSPLARRHAGELPPARAQRTSPIARAHYRFSRVATGAVTHAVHQH